jgi:phosphate starvation-inducible protein PhoH and related proteins
MLLFFNLLINTVNRNTIGCSDFLCNWITKMKSNPASKPSVVSVEFNATQKAIINKWDDSKILLLRGTSGGGKTFISMFKALQDLQNGKIDKVILTRPNISCDEEIGFIPGDVTEKMMPWLGGMQDCLTSMSFNKLEEFNIEVTSVGLLRSRTIRNSILYCDECQNLTFSQLRCILSRIGKGGKIILSGDVKQSDLKISPNPFHLVCQKLVGIEHVNMFNFTREDEMREPLVLKLMDALDS